MYQVTAAQQTSTVKLSTISLRFQSKDHVLRIKKSKITGENTLNGDHFKIKSNYETTKDKKLYFGYFFQFVTRTLTLRLQNTYIFVFPTFLGFCNS